MDELMTLAKNELAKFEAQVELSCMRCIQWYPRSVVMKLKYYKRSAAIFVC